MNFPRSLTGDRRILKSHSLGEGNYLDIRRGKALFEDISSPGGQALAKEVYRELSCGYFSSSRPKAKE